MKFYFSVLLLFVACTVLQAQIVLNEVVSSNNSGLTDEDQEYSDWIELYNVSDSSTNLQGYFLKDDLADTVGWIFPDIELASDAYLVVFASGKDKYEIGAKYQTIISQGDEWQYMLPENLSGNKNWRLPDFDDSDWMVGESGFGYADGDDMTVIQPLNALFIRKEFEIEDVNMLDKLLLHIDFDDSFVAYINGTEIAKENVIFDNGAYKADGSWREAQLYSGGSPNLYSVDLNSIDLVKGKNILAIEGYNANSESSDFSLIPFLTLGSSSFSINNVPEFIAIEEEYLHTNFKIDKDGEGIYLFSSQNELVDSVYVPKMPANYSYGRIPNENNDWAYFPEPTAGSQNQNSINEIRNDTIIFSHSAGLYSSLLHVTLNVPKVDSCSIYYTVNGSEPTLESLQYNGAIPIEKPTSLRAVVYIDSVKTSSVFTQSYIIGAGHHLPVVSLTTDSVNLFDYYEGIYVEGPNAEEANPHYGANYWMDWEKPVNLELFDKNGVQRINQGAGLKIAGAWSRARALKSFALFARSKYGKGSFNYKLFNDVDIDKFESFVLRNSGNDFGESHLRDGLVTELAKPLNIDRLAYQPTVVYINGVYWGIMNMREKPNEHYFDGHFGVDEDELNLIDASREVIHGSKDDYNNLYNFLNSKSVLTDNDYSEAKKMLDESGFIDYQLLHIYICNTDWPGNNIKWWSTSSPHSKIRSLLYDTDFGFGLYNSSYPSHNTIRFATKEDGAAWPNPYWSTMFLRKMVTHSTFQDNFVSRFSDLINSNLNEQFILSKLDSIVGLIDYEMNSHQQRWNRSYNTWQNKIDGIEDFISKREDYISKHFQDFFELNNLNSIEVTVSNDEWGDVQVNTIIPEEYPFYGNYYDGIPITFHAKPKAGYRFEKWEGTSNSDLPIVEIPLIDGFEINAVFEPDNGTEYNVVVNEINYLSTDEYNSGDWLELYNAGLQTINLKNWKIAGSNKSDDYLFTDNLLLYPFSYLVVCRNAKKFSEVYPHVINKTGELKSGLSSKGDVIELFDNNNQLVDRVIYMTSSPWSDEPANTAATLELLNPSLDNSDAENWSAGSPGGTPGAENGIFVSKNSVVKIEKSQISCFPSMFSDYTTLRFKSLGSRSYRISIIDIQGNIKKTVTGEFQNESTHYLDIFTDGSKYPKGLYLVNVQTAKYSETIRVIKN